MYAKKSCVQKNIYVQEAKLSEYAFQNVGI